MGFGTIGELDLSRRTSGYSHQTISATETVQRAVSGALDIPEFQRFIPAGSELRLANDWGILGTETEVVGQTGSSRAEYQALKLIALKLVAIMHTYPLNQRGFRIFRGRR